MIIAVVAVIIVVAVAIGVFLIVRSPQEEVVMDNQIHIQLGSNPFPLTVGQNTLIVQLTRNGEPVDGAQIEIEANRTLQGQLPLYASSSQGEAG